MRFGDRISCSTEKLSKERWRKYRSYLSEIGFSRKNILYRLFGAEVFHDGELSIREIRMADQMVVLQLRNVRAVNEIDALLRSGKGDRMRRLNRADFRTKVTFRKVSRLEIRLVHTTQELYYYCAELGRRHGGHLIKDIL